MDIPNDNTTASSTDQYSSYVNAYQPPATTPVTTPADSPTGSVTPPVSQPDHSSTTENSTEQQPATVWESAQNSSNPVEPAAASEVSSTMSASAPTSSPISAANQSEELADQNIFEMLGVTDGTPEQREQFLSELQQVIWEDFIEHDVKLLLTESEYGEFQGVLQSATDKSEEQQERALEYLEKLIPDLEEIMLEKALQLKEEMVKERLRALRQLHAQDPAKLAVIDQAEAQMTEQLWRSATLTLAKV